MRNMLVAISAFLATAAMATPITKQVNYVVSNSAGSKTSSKIAVQASSKTISDSSYKDLVVLHHHVHRANHTNTNDLTWSAGIYNDAMTVAKDCKYAHNTMDKYGQNIAAGIDKNNIGGAISDAFYNGEVNHFVGKYGETQPQETDGSFGHFTQVVWKGSTQVACYTADCSATGIDGIASDSGIPPYLTVCNYLPPGNYGNEYKANIGDSKHQKTITGSYTGDLTITYE